MGYSKTSIYDICKYIALRRPKQLAVAIGVPMQ